jgi:hypothetical protein
MSNKALPYPRTKDISRAQRVERYTAYLFGQHAEGWIGALSLKHLIATSNNEVTKLSALNVLDKIKSDNRFMSEAKVRAAAKRSAANRLAKRSIQRDDVGTTKPKKGK